MQTLETFKKHLVTQPSQLPTTPHFIVVVFGIFEFSEAGYETGDTPTYRSIPTTNMYVFESEETWRNMITAFVLEQIKPSHQPTHNQPQIRFFHSGGAAAPEIQINVNARISKA